MAGGLIINFGMRPTLPPTPEIWFSLPPALRVIVRAQLQATMVPALRVKVRAQLQATIAPAIQVSIQATQCPASRVSLLAFMVPIALGLTVLATIVPQAFKHLL